MKIARLSLFILFAACLVAGAQTDYVQKELNVTVYNDNLGVVRDIRKMDIKKGLSDIKIIDVPSEIDATTVHAKLDGTVLEQNYQYDLVNIYKIMNKYLDKDISRYLTESQEAINFYYTVEEKSTGIKIHT